MYKSQMPLTFAGSELVALCLESVFYGMIPTVLLGPVLIPHYFQFVPIGIYLLIFLEHLEVIFRKQRRRAMGASLRLPVVIATSAIFALVTMVCVDSHVSQRIWELRCYSLIHLPPPVPNSTKS